MLQTRPLSSPECSARNRNDRSSVPSATGPPPTAWMSALRRRFTGSLLLVDTSCTVGLASHTSLAWTLLSSYCVCFPCPLLPFWGLFWELFCEFPDPAKATRQCAVVVVVLPEASVAEYVTA